MTDGADVVIGTQAQAFDHLILSALEQAGNIVAVLEAADVSSGLQVVSANAAFSRAFGRDLADVKGYPADFLLGNDNDPERATRLQSAIRLNRPLQETIALKINGHQIWIGLRLMPAFDGASKRFVMLGRDITERKRRAAADEAMQLLLGHAFRQAEVAMALVENSGTIVMSNTQFHKLCSRPASAIDGVNLQTFLHPEDISAAVERRERQNADGKSYSALLRLIGPNEEVSPVQFHCNVLEHRSLRRLRIVTLTPVAASKESTPAQSVVLAGGIRLIGLEEVRQTFGSRWPALAERVMATADDVLTAYLQPGESFTRQSNGTGYVVCFASPNVEESETRAAAITREIRTRLLAENADANYAAMTLAIDPQPISQTELAQPAEALSHLLEKRLLQRQSALEDQARACLTEAATGVSGVLLQVTTPASLTVPLALLDLPTAKRSRLNTAMLTLPEPELRGFDPTRLRLAALAEMAFNHDSTDKSMKWIVPIDYDSVTLRFRREKCFEQLSGFPILLRQRLTPLLSQLPQSVYHARVDELLRVLKTFGRTVGIEVDNLDELPFDPKSSAVALVVVKGSMLLNLLRRNRSAGALATLQRLRVESIRIVARDTDGLSVADLTSIGVDMIVNESQPVTA